MPIVANITHPVVPLLVGIWAAPIIGGGLLIEGWFARSKFNLRMGQAIAAVLTVNLASAMLAIPIAAVGFEGLARIEQSLHLKLQGGGWQNYDTLPSFLLAFIVTTLINALFEAWMIKRFWNVPSECKVYRWWLLANALSNGLVFLVLLALFLR